MADEIDVVWIKDPKLIPDERARLMGILRNDDEGFDRFGQIYLSTIGPGVVKGWHVINVPTEPSNRESPDKYRVAWDRPDIPYSWDIVFQ
jgi:dTDP-4-dehydrorhamnose 3,5-epimerase-like enzyme